MEMEERFFPHLLQIEPKAVELTKQEYEDYRGIERRGSSSKRAEDVREAVPEDTAKEAGAPFQGTKAEAEEILKGRGFTASQLRGKRRQELIDML